jgi:hypothetical protein
LDFVFGSGLRPLIIEAVSSELRRGLVERLRLHSVDGDGGGVNEFPGPLRQRSRHHVSGALDIGSPLPFPVAGPQADIAGDMKNGIEVFGHGALERGSVFDLPLDKPDGMFLQLREPGV